MAHDVFISHASADSTIAQAVCARLEEQGIRCWIAPRDIHPGSDWRSNIVKGIQEARALVLVFSASANASQEVPREIAQATKHGLSIVTFRIEDVVPSGSLDYDLSTVHWLDAMTPPLEANIQRLGDALRLILDTPPAATTSGVPGWKTRLGRIALIAVAFVCTGLALDHGGLGTLVPTFPSAAFFGLLLAILVLPHWAERLIVAAVSIPVYHGAVLLFHRVPNSRFSFVPSAVLGAVAMNLAVALFDKRLLRALPAAAASGLAGGLGFPYLFGWASHAMWQTLVGCAIVSDGMRAPRAASRLPRRTTMTMGAVAGLALLFIPLSRTLVSHLQPALTADEKVNSVDGLTYRWIPPGQFSMGCSPEDDDCFNDESPAHEVTITKGFRIGECEVTVDAWRTVMKSMPPKAEFWGRDLNPGWSQPDMPVTNVEWAGAANYCEAVGGRLPTEAEWEYAARAGKPQARYLRLAEIAWYANNSGDKYQDIAGVREADFTRLLADNKSGPHPVKAVMRSNDWSLFDMLGNVAEWVRDDYGDRAYDVVSAQPDPEYRSGSSSEGHKKIARGGSWFSRDRAVRASARMALDPTYKGPDVGFRCVWTDTTDK